MKRYIFLSVMFIFFGTALQAQLIKTQKIHLEKKTITTAKVGKNEKTATRSKTLPTHKCVVTRISMQATTFKKRNK